MTDPNREVWRTLPTGPTKHFHDASGKLLATIAIAPTDDGRFDVGVARCRHTDSPTRSWGRKLALERLDRFQKYKSASSSEKAQKYAVVEREIKKGLLRSFSREELVQLITENPFAKEDTPYCQEDYDARRASRRSLKK